ncbi:MAG: hypothetical protein AB7P56_06645 [Nitrososphaeraceae archaeon]
MKRISVFIIDKIVIQIRCKHYYLLWIAMDPVDKTKIGINISELKYACCETVFAINAMEIWNIVFIRITLFGIQKLAKYLM